MANLNSIDNRQLRDILADLQYLSIGQRGNPDLVGSDDGLRSQAVPFWQDLMSSGAGAPVLNAQPSLDSLFASPVSASRKKTIDGSLRETLGKDPSLMSPLERRAVEGALILGEYNDVTLDGEISAVERGYIADYAADYDAGLSAQDIAQQNIDERTAEQQRLAALEAARIAEQEAAAAAAQAEIATAEAAALAQTELEGRLTAALVRGGFLKLDKIDLNNPQALAEARVLALDEMFQNNFGEIGTYKMIDYFDPEKGFEPKPAALERALAMTSGTTLLPEDLKALLESGNEAQINLAQNYLNISGQSVTVTGALNRETVEAAERAMNAPFTLPDGIIGANGEVYYGELINAVAHGQVRLPSTEADLVKYGMSPAQATYAMSLSTSEDAGILNRDQFIARAMIKDNPEMYEAYAAGMSAELANPSSTHRIHVEAAFAQPVVDDPEVATNNPLNLPASGSEEYALANGAVVNSNNAIGQTTDGTAIYNGDEGIYSFVDYMRSKVPADAEGVQNLTMKDALYLFEEARQTVGDDNLEWVQAASPGGGLRFDQQYADRLEMMVRETKGGPIEPGKTFSLDNPTDIEMLVTAMSATAKAQGGELDMNGQNGNLIVAYTEQFPDDLQGIERVAKAGGIRPQAETTMIAEAPAADATTVAQPNNIPVADRTTFINTSMTNANVGLTFQSAAENATSIALLMKSEIDVSSGLSGQFAIADANTSGVRLDATPEETKPGLVGQFATADANKSGVSLDATPDADTQTGFVIDPNKVVTAGFSLGGGR